MARERHGADAVAVIGAGEGDEAAAAGGGGERAHHRLVGVGPGMAEPHFSWRPRRQGLQQRLGEAHRRLGDGREDAGAGHRGGGAAHGLDHRGMAIAEAGGTPMGREIEQPPAILGHQIGALAGDDGKWEEAQLLQGRDHARVARYQGLGSGGNGHARTPEDEP
jgi:hypothetical protein